MSDGSERPQSVGDVEPVYSESLRTPWWWYLIAAGVASLLAAEFHVAGLRLTDWIPFGTLIPLAIANLLVTGIVKVLLLGAGG